MPTLTFTCPFCKREEHPYEDLDGEPGRRCVPHACPGVGKRSYVFVDRHTRDGTPIYLRCTPAAVPSPA